MRRTHTRLRLALCIFAATTAAGLRAQSTPKTEHRPLRLGHLLGDPDWLTVRGDFLLRAQGIDGQFRTNPAFDRSDALLVQRTALLFAADLEKLDLGPLGVTVEVADMRQYGGAVGSAIGTGTVNAFDVLQAHVDLRLGELGSGTHRLRVGRETLDLGSRRLVARHKWRTAINAFTGVDWEWRDRDDGSVFRAFWTMAVRRLPNDRPSVLDNDVELDQENVENQFLGFFHTRPLSERLTFEDYTYVQLETNGVSRRRRIATPGLRVYSKRRKGAVDVEFEGAGQFGTSRLTTGGPDLNHLAYFVHASVGYTFDAPWSPNLRVAFDYASGDRNPNDGENNRFESLFGIQRPDFGPTEIYLALRRQNISSPELRLRVRPRDDFWAYVAYRPAWLASRSDRWLSAGAVDPTGNSGNFVGHQAELRARWTVIPDQMNIEFGGALLFAGGFARNAPNARNVDTTAFGYVQTVVRF